MVDIIKFGEQRFFGGFDGDNIKREDACKSKQDSLLYSVFNKKGNDNEALEQVELEDIFSTIKTSAATNGDNVWDRSEIETFLKNTKAEDNRSLFEHNITVDSVLNFFKNIFKKAGNEEIKVESDTKEAEDRYNALYEKTDKYNILNKDIDTELFKDAKSIVQDFQNEFGMLDSTSRAGLLKIDEKENATRGYDLIRQRRNYSSISEKLEAQIQVMKEYNYANCGECQSTIIKMIYDKYGDKYDVSTITISPDNNESHVAVLIKSKESDEEYIIDNWINPSGGIYPKDEWAKMIQDVYSAGSCEIKTDHHVIDQLAGRENFVRSLKETRGRTTTPHKQIFT